MPDSTIHTPSDEPLPAERPRSTQVEPAQRNQAACDCGLPRFAHYPTLHDTP